MSETAGTTRDVIEVHLDLGGWPVVLADTAGLREVRQRDRAGRRAPRRAREASADLRLLVLAATGDWRSERDKLVASTERWDDRATSWS